ncbi:hypothetical protein BT69DRAFT_1211835 [Atractiella rhizophila]|nr:hypothetical protein BT69DRAFT_1211835 [Atractiella rhizophila]
MSAVDTPATTPSATPAHEPYVNGVCVFCGSNPGKDPAFTEAATQLGTYFASKNITLVYGGGSLGLMGTVSSSCLKAGGVVHGVRPSQFDDLDIERGVAPTSVATARGGTEKMTMVKSMHDRKTLMARLSERGFVVLPGGFGTFEELFEMTTWTQIGVHRKPVILLSVNGFYSGLRDFVHHAHKSGFIAEANLELLRFVEPPKEGQEAEFNWGAEAEKELEKWEKEKDQFTRGAYKLTWDLSRT